jgi:hypothetical protein
VYTPNNVDVYTAAYSGAMAGMAIGGRSNTATAPSKYRIQGMQAGAFAQSFDTAYGATSYTQLTIELIFLGGYGTFDGRQPDPGNPNSFLPSTYTPQAEAIIAVIEESDIYFDEQGITPNAWNSGGGGSLPSPPGAGYFLQSTGTAPTDVEWSLIQLVPTPPGAGDVLTSNGSAFGDYDWETPGGFTITGYSKTNGSSFEVGASDVNPAFTISYSELPDSASIAWPGGGPLVLTTPFTSGTITHTFTSNTNGTTFSFVLTAIRSATSRSSTITDTFGLPFLSIITTVGAVVATQGFLDTMRAAETVGVHTSAAGTYLAGQNVAAGDISAIAIPVALDSGVIWTDNETGLPVSPSFVGEVSGYTNPHGVAIPMNLYTVGGIGVGTVSWSLS